jgi:hypothetical protein
MMTFNQCFTTFGAAGSERRLPQDEAVAAA